MTYVGCTRQGQQTDKAYRQLGWLSDLGSTKGNTDKVLQVTGASSA